MKGATSQGGSNSTSHETMISKAPSGDKTPTARQRSTKPLPKLQTANYVRSISATVPPTRCVLLTVSAIDRALEFDAEPVVAIHGRGKVKAKMPEPIVEAGQAREQAAALGGKS